MSSHLRNEKPSPRARIGGIISTILFHGALLGLFIYFGFKPVDPPPTFLQAGDGGMEVMMGDPLAGGPDPLPSEDPQVPEEAAAEPTPDESALTDIYGEPIDNTTSKEKTDKKKVKDPERTVDRNSLFPPKDKKAGSGDGEVPGNEGGEGNGTDPKGGGTGTRPGKGLGGRGVLYRPKVTRENDEDGVVMVKITVNRDGKVIKAEGGQKESTVTDVNTVSRAEKIARQYRFASDPDAAEREVGIIKIDFRPQ